jgi:hypothetical protein
LPAVSDVQVSVVHFQVADLEDILKEKGECGVGYIANIKNRASHKIVQQALTALGCMEHRGGCSADNDSGDGAGIMTRIPWALFQDYFKEKGLPALDEKQTGVGMLFLPRDPKDAEAAKAREFIILANKHLFSSVPSLAHSGVINPLLRIPLVSNLLQSGCSKLVLPLRCCRFQDRCKLCIHRTPFDVIGRSISMPSLCLKQQ